ncbi:MAG: cytochrome c [Anaerolineae bacterium]|nr:cytochrome c [Anaerolineae bacterium]
MKLILSILCLMALLLTAGCGGNAADDSPATGSAAPPALDPQRVAQGETIYAERCAECHGASLEGEADWKSQNADGSFRSPPHDASGHTWHHSDAQLIDAVRLGGARLGPAAGGTSAMPAFGDALTGDEIAAVLDFIKSTWPAEMRQYQWEVTQQAQQ